MISIFFQMHLWFISLCAFVDYSRVEWSPNWGICCISVKLAALRRKCKVGLAWNQDVFEWVDMSIVYPTKHVFLVLSGS